MKSQKLKKEKCEICGETNKATLHLHHIIERTELNCTNYPYNLCCICANCHNLVHAKIISIIGVFPSTKKNGRMLVYVKDDVCNVPGFENEDPYFVPETKSSKINIKEDNDE